jgi:hypothetical protein
MGVHTKGTWRTLCQFRTSARCRTAASTSSTSTATSRYAHRRAHLSGPGDHASTVSIALCAVSHYLFACRSGRQAHNILHKHNNITVRGAWNNYEGVGACTPDPESPNSGRNDGSAPAIGGETTVTEQQLITPFLADSGYHTLVSGKTDWAAGGHSLTTMVDSWSIYARFPYDIPSTGGWHIWGDCGGNLTVNPGSESAPLAQGDWAVPNSTTAWLVSAEAKASARTGWTVT